MPTLHDRIAGGLWGLLVGDALGVPYEFHPPGELPPFHKLEMIPPAGFRRAHASVPPGTWSDDGAQALALLDSLLHCGRLDPDDFGRRLLDWYQRGYLAVDGDVFDIGIQTRSALHALRDGAPALEAGPRHEDANGNGSLMRALPLALWHRGSDEDLVRDAQLQSRITHGHLRAQICCALYVLWARYLLRGLPDAWSLATATLRKIYGASPEAMGAGILHPSGRAAEGEGDRLCRGRAPLRAAGPGCRWLRECREACDSAWQRYRHHGVYRRRDFRHPRWGRSDSGAMDARTARPGDRPAAARPAPGAVG